MRWAVYERCGLTWRSYGTREEAEASYNRHGRLILKLYGPAYAASYAQSHEVVPMRVVRWRQLCHTVRRAWPLFLFALLLGAGLAL